MMNMSYCRFENTYSALLECKDALSEIDSLDDLSESEKRYALKLKGLCECMAEWIEE